MGTGRLIAAGAILIFPLSWLRLIAIGQVPPSTPVVWVWVATVLLLSVGIAIGRSGLRARSTLDEPSGPAVQRVETPVKAEPLVASQNDRTVLIIEKAKDALRKYILSDNWHPAVPIVPIGQVEPVCPACGSILARFPKRPISCPDCAEKIFVRVRPIDKRQVLLTEEDVAALVAQKAVIANSKIYSKPTEEEVEPYRARLLARFGQEPSFGDKAWAFFQHQHFDAWAKGSMTNCRWVQFQRAVHLDQTRKFRHALSYYFKTLYLDLAGATTGDILNDQGEIETCRFHEKSVDFNPFIIRPINRIISTELMSPDEVEKVFMRDVQQERKETRCPLPAEEIWPGVRNVIFGPLQAS